MACTDEPARGRTAVWLLPLGLGGLASLLAGLSWGAVLPAFATDLARTENAFNLINPDHIPLANAIVAGIVGLGRFLLVFGVAATLVALIGAAYACLVSRRSPGWSTPGLRHAFVAGSGALVLLATGSAAWATGGVSYEDGLAAEPTDPSGSAGEREDHAHCAEPPTPGQQEAADELAAQTRASVAKYAAPSVAEAEGYRPISPGWRPVAHYLNPAYQRDGEVLDPTRPEALVYANDTSKGTVLLGAMYLMPEPGVSGPPLGGCLARWHAHSLLGRETPEMMHVWTVDIPGGPYSELRPRQFVSSLEG